MSTSTIQAQDTIKKPLRNVIKINFTNVFVYDVPIVFEYERLLKRHQSFTIQAGYARLPFETNTDSLRLTANIKQSGFTLTGDYRFYIAKENKYAAPHGIYIAPFIGYQHFYNERDLELTDDSSTIIPLNLKSNINFTSIGVALGYQFVFGKRWTIDLLLLGPSITNYNVKMDLNGDISEAEINDIERAILEKLAQSFPFVSSLVEDDIATFTGNTSSWNYGFRYSIHFGFMF